MKKFSIFMALFLKFALQESKAQCPVEIGYHYNIYLFSSTNNFSLKELLGLEINPMFVNVILVNDEAKKKSIDQRCLSGKIDTSIFIYPSHDSAKIIRFCNSEEYATALKKNMQLKIE